MKSFFYSVSIFSLAFSLLPLGGCRICLDTHDLDYPAYGGAWQRTQRDSGRVGSVFDPGGAKVAALVEREDPLTPDVMERMKQSAEGTQDPDRQPDFEGDSSSEEFEEMDPTPELMDKNLEDIEEEQDSDLRERRLEDIEIRIKRRVPEA